MVEPYVWFKTADGSVHEVETEVASFCPSICHEIDSGVGHSRNYPIALPPRVNPAMLSLIFDYCRFHHIPGRSNKAIHVSLSSHINFFESQANFLPFLKRSLGGITGTNKVGKLHYIKGPAAQFSQGCTTELNLISFFTLCRSEGLLTRNLAVWTQKGSVS